MALPAPTVISIPGGPWPQPANWASLQGLFPTGSWPYASVPVPAPPKADSNSPDGYQWANYIDVAIKAHLTGTLWSVPGLKETLGGGQGLALTFDTDGEWSLPAGWSPSTVDDVSPLDLFTLSGETYAATTGLTVYPAAIDVAVDSEFQFIAPTGGYPWTLPSGWVIKSTGASTFTSLPFGTLLQWTNPQGNVSTWTVQVFAQQTAMFIVQKAIDISSFGSVSAGLNPNAVTPQGALGSSVYGLPTVTIPPEMPLSGAAQPIISGTTSVNVTGNYFQPGPFTWPVDLAFRCGSTASTPANQSPDYVAGENVNIAYGIFGAPITDDEILSGLILSPPAGGYGARIGTVGFYEGNTVDGSSACQCPWTVDSITVTFYPVAIAGPPPQPTPPPPQPPYSVLEVDSLRGWLHVGVNKAIETYNLSDFSESFESPDYAVDNWLGLKADPRRGALYMLAQSGAGLRLFRSRDGGQTADDLIYVWRNMGSINLAGLAMESERGRHGILYGDGGNNLWLQYAPFFGLPLKTTYVSPTEMTVVIPAAHLAAAQALNLLVSDPAPGFGLSGAVKILIAPGENSSIPDAEPTLTSVAPNTASAGVSDTTVSVTCESGTGAYFAPTSTVLWNGEPLATTYVNGLTLTAVIPAALLAAGGLFYVTVDSADGSDALFAVNNPGPTLASIGPNSATAGSGDLILTVTGSGFCAASQVQYAGGTIATTYVSPTELTAVIPAALLESPAAQNVTVVNPSPAGGRSASKTFTVNPTGGVYSGPAPTATPASSAPAPTLASVAPNTAVAPRSPWTPVGNSDLVVTLTGSGFVSGSQAMLYGDCREWSDAMPVTLGTSSAGPLPQIIGEVADLAGDPRRAALLLSLFDNAAGTTTNSTLVSTDGGDTWASEVSALYGSPICATFGAQILGVVSESGLDIMLWSDASGLVWMNSALWLSPVNPIANGPIGAWGAGALKTAFVSASTLTAIVPAAYLAVAGVFTVTVVNPDVGPIGSASFAVNPPSPAAPYNNLPGNSLGSISPAKITAGANDATITLSAATAGPTSANFVVGSQVYWGPVPVTMNGAQLVAQVYRTAYDPRRALLLMSVKLPGSDGSFADGSCAILQSTDHGATWSVAINNLT